MTKTVTLDELDLIVLLVVGALTFTDFLIGPKGRQALKEKVGYWWIYVAETSFAGFASHDAQKIQLFLRRMFGNRWFSWRCFGTSVIAGIVLTYLGTFASFYMVFGAFYGWKDLVVKSVLFSGFSLPSGVLSVWLSVGLSDYVFGRMGRSVTPGRLIAYMCIDILGMCALTALALLIVDVAGPTLFVFLSDIFDSFKHE
jgi:hypothetical protein